MAKNSASVFMSPSGSSSAARRFILKTPKTGYVTCVAWQVVRDHQAVSGKIPETRFQLWFSDKMQSQPRIQHDSIKIK